MVKKIREKKNIPGPGNYEPYRPIGVESKSFKFSKENKFVDKKPIRESTPGPSEKSTGLTKSKTIGNFSKINSKYVSENTLTNTIYKSNNFPGPACYTPRKQISSIGTT